ncbi:hypothetical protein [Hungatella hathewayi]|uniref:hypothetical protein n=1 Tax=Hungatella hathewayi TaxID=154046 RepID=UPI003567A507
MAELAFGGTDIIVWTDPSQREPCLKGINGYTFIFNERDKCEFGEFVKPRYEEWSAIQGKNECMEG